MQSSVAELGVITTVSGRSVDVVHPEPEMFYIEDIARALAMQVRYIGQVRRFYSVAEHSFFVSMLVGEDPETQLWALLHDASEAYTGDMASPIKHLPEMSAYRLIERRVTATICKCFNLPFREPEIVKYADLGIRINEQMHLKGRKLLRGESELPVKLAFWSPEQAEKMFLERFHSLQLQLAQEKIYA